MKFRGVLKLLFVLVVGYLILGLLSLCLVLNKYRTADLSAIEPSQYVPDMAKLVFNEKDTRTSFNTYRPTLDSMGARNLFEISPQEENTVVLLGDSNTFGLGLDDTKTISYFLNQLDPERRYINLAFPGANLIDSVAIYHAKWKDRKPPRSIIFQVTYSNDLCAALQVEAIAAETVEKDFKFILPPFDLIFDKNRLLHFYLERLYEKIYRDASRERFIQYYQEPLDQLLEEIDEGKTDLKIITIGRDEHHDLKKIFTVYDSWLNDYCVKNNIDCFAIEDLLDHEAFTSQLPDGHPTAYFNEELAKQLLRRTSAAAGVQ